MKKFVALLVATLVVGVMIGSAGSGETTTPSAVAKPAPTVTVTTAADTVTETVTEVVKETPQSCLDAIDAAEEVARGVVVFTEAAGTYPVLVGEAFEAGLMGNESQAQDVLSQMEDANAGMEDANAIVLPAVREFNKAKEKCRS